MNYHGGRSGEWFVYHEVGAKAARGRYAEWSFCNSGSNDLGKIGLWEYFDERGQLLKEIDFKSGSWDKRNRMCF